MLAVKAAIQDPASPEAMTAILELGHDSRYYVMTRGWLSLQLQGDLSIMDANQGDASPEIVERIELLREAIRAIDLE